MISAAAERSPGPERYTLVRELGVGGMGVVYEAIEKASGARVALKMLPAVDPHALFGFKNEFRSLAALVHPNLVSLYELVADQDRWYFTMELVNGGDFLSHVRRSPDVERLVAAGEPAFAELADEAKLRTALAQLAEGVQALHLNGVLHRDLKPPNVLVRSDGRVAVLDFGLAVALGEKLNTRERASGTLMYMSPEQLGGDPLGPPTDWYAVGVMLYEALTGRAPFAGAPQAMFFAKMSGSVIPPRDLVRGVPEDLNTLCMELLDPDPERRPTGKQLLARLASANDTVHSRPERAFVHSRLFVGREDLLGRLDAGWSAARHGATVTAYVHGRSGAGKSALLEQFLIDARQDESVVVFSGRCYEQESVPFKAVDTIVDALTRWLLRQEELDDLLPRTSPPWRASSRCSSALTIAGAPRDALTFPDPRELRRVLGALREILVRVGQRAPLIVAIDDLQWGDVDSAELLASILESPGAPRLLFVAAFRSEYRDSSPCLRALTSGLASPRHRPGAHDDIEVEPLDESAAAMLAGALLHQRAEAVAARIADESGGNPFFIHELARYANEHPRSRRVRSGVRPRSRTLVASRAVGAAGARDAGIGGDRRKAGPQPSLA
jgi:serine/threonine protein kinase